MRDKQQSLLRAGRSLVESAPARHRAVWVYGVYGLITDAVAWLPMSKIKDTTLRLLPGYLRAMPTVQQANRASASDMDGFADFSGVNEGWARTEYGEYYATSAPVYSAVRLRVEALSRAPAVVYRTTPEGARVPVGRDHPAQRILEGVNDWHTSRDLWRAKNIYLNLWGSAFWAIDHNEQRQTEIWLLRPDRVSIVPDRRRYRWGFVYNGRSGQVPYTLDEMVWFRYFNPLEEYAGLSPIAPVRMAADMGKDSLRFNGNFLRNLAQPDFVLLTNEAMTDKEIEEFYRR